MRPQRARLKFVTRFGYGEALPTDELQDGPFEVFGSNGAYASFSRSNTKSPVIVVGRKGSYGKINWSDRPVFASDTTFVVDETTTPYSLRWIYWLLQSLKLDEGSEEAAVPGLNREDAYACEVTLFPPDTQIAIARFLDRETADIDALISAKQLLLDLLAEKRRAIVAEAIMRGPNPAGPLRPSGIDWLGDIPAHWEMKRSKWLFEERDERSTDGSEILLSLRMERGLVPHNEVSEKVTRPEELIGYKKTSVGQLVVNRMRAATGLIAITTQDGLVSPDYAVFWPSPEIVADYYVEMFKTPLLQAVFRSESTGLGTGSQGFLRLYSQNFLALWFPYPPLDEQREIVTHITAETAKINRLRAATEHSITLLKERRCGLIAAAVTGQIGIPEAA